MVVATLVAGGGSFYFAKANIKAEDFNRSVQLISQDENSGWCDLANGHVVNAHDGSKHCAIHMPDYVKPEGDK
ncbi:hypothetical protein [Yoonia sp. R78084]|uniref:hypothetical protein n=1 Tax=Yoonia sp. R78084 TaxID=3093869 RepID=UPI0037DD4C12